MRLQDPASFSNSGFAGLYAFGFRGWDNAGGSFAMAGSANANAGTLGSIAADINDAGNLSSGLTGGAGAVQLMRSMLYGMSPFDWPVFTTVVLVLTATAAFASILPAWRATRLDPAQALRTE